MEQQTSTARVGLKWGVISGVISMVFAVIMYTTGMFMNQSMTWIGMLITIILIVLAIRDFRTQNGGFMTYGEGVSTGTFVAAISGLISGSFNYIYTAFIDTTIPQQMRDMMEEQWAEQGLTDEQIEQASQYANTFQSPGVLFLFGVIGAVTIGLIISLIASAFLRRDKPFAEFQ